MKKVLLISLFVLGLIIPNIDVKAVDVSNEEQLRAAIEQGGDITLTQDIEVTEPLVINKDVNLNGDYKHILMQDDKTLLTINSGNVIFENTNLIAGWSGDKFSEGSIIENVIKNRGKALVINGGTVNLNNSELDAGNVGLEVNGGTVTGYLSIFAGVENDNESYSGGQGMIVNGGNVDAKSLYIQSGGTALKVSANMNLSDATSETSFIFSYEGNGIEINDNSIINLKGSRNHPIAIFGSKNAIYLNGGTANLNGFIMIQTISQSKNNGYGLYVSKASADNDVIKFGRDFVFTYDAYGSNSNLSIYVNPEIDELHLTNEKNFLEFSNNKLTLDFCSSTSYALGSQSEEEKKAICANLDSNLDGPIESNELGKCTVVYINGEKQNEVDSSCNPVSDEENNNPEVVEVPSTSAYGSIIIAVLGIICVVVSVFVMRKMTNKA